MHPDPSSPGPDDRRSEAGLCFDPDRGLLSLGSYSVRLAPDADNRSVLVAYVELAAHSRRERVANVVEVRQGDVVALATALDLDAADLAAQIEQILGASRAEALRVVSRLRETRVLSGIARAATAAAVAGTLAVSCASGRVASPPPRVPIVAASAQAAVQPAPTGSAPVVDGPLTVDDQGVGLIPAVSVDADGTGLVPPVSIDRDLADD